MAWRYWVTETVQTFNSWGTRVFRKEETLTFDSLVEASVHISLLQTRPPVVIGGGCASQHITLEGQEISAAVVGIDMGEKDTSVMAVFSNPTKSAEDLPRSNFCPYCGSLAISFQKNKNYSAYSCISCGIVFGKQPRLS